MKNILKISLIMILALSLMFCIVACGDEETPAPDNGGENNNQGGNDNTDPSNPSNPGDPSDPGDPGDPGDPEPPEDPNPPVNPDLNYGEWVPIG